MNNCIIKLKYCTAPYDNYPIGDGDHGQIVPSMYLDNGIPYIRVQNLDFTNKIKMEGLVYISEEINRKNRKSILKPGDILLAKTGATIGKAGILPETIPCANTTSSVGKISLDCKRFSNKYVYYWIASDLIQTEIQKIASTKSAQPGFNIEDIKNFSILYVNKNTQEKIAEYLDSKVSSLDKMIEDCQNGINLLKDYKFSLISKVVLNGFNHIEFKFIDELMGKIPSDWNIDKIKNLCFLKGRIGWQGLTTDEYQEEGPYLITGTDFKDGSIDFETCVHISEKRYNLDKNIQIKENDLLITKDGTVGKLAIVKNMPGPTSLNSGVMIIRNIKQKYLTKYLYYVLSSSYFWEWYDYNQRGQTSIKHLYQEQFGDFSVPLPSIIEQEKIIDYLDKKCKTIDELIEIKQKKIETLKEYKKSLIYECVTGKKVI